MKMIFTGKVSGEKTVLAAGARHTVKAQAGEQYGLVDEVTGLVPDGMEADRSGDDLILRKKEDSTEVRIEGFWEECQPGETQCTAVFNVVGENGQVTEAVLTQDGPVLENFTAGQSGTLAGGINNGIIWGGIAFGTGLAAIALAAGGGSGSSRHKRTAEGEQKPVQPEGGQETGEVEAKVAAAESAEKAAEDELVKVNQDGVVGKAEAERLTELNAAVTAAKADAQQAVDGLQDGPVKTGFSERLDKLDGIKVPAVTDANDDGVADDKAAEVEAKVAAAESAEKAAEDELVKVNQDGVVGKAEAERLTELNAAVTAAKADAQQAVDGLQDGPVKTGFSERLDKLDGIKVPAVTDANDDGVADDKAAEVEAKVAAAESAEKAAEDELVKVNQDGVVGKAEAERLTELNAAVTAAKADAQQAVDGLQDGPVKTGFSERLDKLDGIKVPAVNDQDGNGKPDDQDAQEAFENAKVHVEKALNTVYQTNDDLYAKYAASFNKPAGNVDGSTTLWKPVLNKNNGAYFSSARNAIGEFKYIYNGLNDTDIISTKYSIGGTGRTMTTRNDMDILTGEGDDIIAVGQDIGRSYSTGYTDKKYLTDMGDGNDILFVGLSNENVQINLRADGSLRAIKKGDYFTSGEIINVSGDYDSDSGGVISSTTIKMGNGDDTILALGWSDGGNAVQNSIIELGSGNDTMQVNGTIEASKIDGGAGFDTLIISNGTISSESFTGFEKIELMSSGHLVLHSKDFSNHDIGGILKVTGETGSSVNIQDFNWQQDRLGRIEEDGVSYTTYISAEYPDLSLWVQDGIDIR
ncbi:GA-like domain-containing protein [Escherichia coli]|uniref:GA-like domain-containing protein n=3 Tax=Escherichia coli TaxID=562 RepID=UPI0020265993|nr:hypothetical protein [Escherichia coli]